MKNLRNFFLQLLSGILLIVIINSCEELSSQDEEIYRFKNPFEFVGETHNDGLAYALEKMGNLKTGENDLQNICNLSTTFMLSREDYDFKINDYHKFIEFENFIKERLVNETKGLDTCSIFRQGTKANRLYVKLDNVFNKIDIKDTIKSFEAIKKLEYEISNSKISEKEKAELLLMSSIGRHSFSFWKATLPKIHGLDETKNEEIYKDLLEILKADMIGGFLGFIGGAIVGAIGGTLIMPGVGSVTGAVLEGMQAAVWAAIIGSLWQVFVIYALPYLIKSEIEPGTYLINQFNTRYFADQICINFGFNLHYTQNV